MRTPLLSEPIFDMVKDKLVAELNDKLASADFQYTDGVALEPIPANKIYPSNKYQPLSPPAIYILVQTHNFQYAQRPNYMESDDSALVVVTMEEVGADLLVKKAWRYARAVYGVLNLADLIDTADRVHLKLVPTRIGYTDPISGQLNNDERRFRMDAVIEFSIKHFEGNVVA